MRPGSWGVDSGSPGSCQGGPSNFTGGTPVCSVRPLTTREIRRRPGGRAARVVRAVTEATLSVMADKGFAGFTIVDVVTRSGVSEASIYRRWGSRDNLLIETLLSCSERTVLVPDTGSIRIDLAELVYAIAAYFGTPVGNAVGQVLASSDDESHWAKVHFDFWSSRLAAVQTIVDRAVERNELSPGTNPRLLLETLVAPLQLRTLIAREPLDSRQCHQLVELVLDGVLPRPVG
jgi:AcrR family transcriptional regulator